MKWRRYIGETKRISRHVLRGGATYTAFDEDIEDGKVMVVVGMGERGFVLTYPNREEYEREWAEG